MYNVFVAIILLCLKKCESQYSTNELMEGMKMDDAKKLNEVGIIVRDIVASSYSETPRAVGAASGIWFGGTVPYMIDIRSYDDKLVKELDNFFLSMQKLTGITFKKMFSSLSNDDRYLLIINRKGISECLPVDNVPSSGVVRLTIGYKCFDNYYLSRYTMQVLGIPLQHTAPNRDDYIEIITENIAEDKLKYFEKTEASNWPFECQLSYDLNSVTHFHPLEFTKNGKETFKLKKGLLFTKPIRLSQDDLMKIDVLYHKTVQKPIRENALEMCRRLFKF